MQATEVEERKKMQATEMEERISKRGKQKTRNLQRNGVRRWPWTLAAAPAARLPAGEALPPPGPSRVPAVQRCPTRGQHLYERPTWSWTPDTRRRGPVAYRCPDDRRTTNRDPSGRPRRGSLDLSNPQLQTLPLWLRYVLLSIIRNTYLSTRTYWSSFFSS